VLRVLLLEVSNLNLHAHLADPFNFSLPSQSVPVSCRGKHEPTVAGSVLVSVSAGGALGGGVAALLSLASLRAACAISAAMFQRTSLPTRGQLHTCEETHAREGVRQGTLRSLL
jgi:hypothetical protein